MTPPESSLVELAEVMARLRAECPWKARQTHESLVRYLIEETYELVEALESGDATHVREELGDVLLQVFFHAAIAAESGEYDVEDVAAELIAKLRRRNPHVFAGIPLTGPMDDADEVNAIWQQVKATEKTRTSLADGIAEGLPSLARAHKLLERRDDAGLPPPELDVTDVGDRLLALVEEARAAGVDPEQALRASLRRWEER